MILTSLAMTGAVSACWMSGIAVLILHAQKRVGMERYRINIPKVIKCCSFTAKNVTLCKVVTIQYASPSLAGLALLIKPI